MLKKIISILLIFIAFIPSTSFSQKRLERQVFIRTGVDLSRFAIPYINDFGPSGVEISFDTEIHYNFFPTLELGYSNIEDYNEIHKYDLYGNYFRVGLNYNITKYKHRLDRSIFFIGVRYSYSNFSHSAEKINITNQWGTIESSFPKTQLNAHWIEAVIGIRGEIYKNFYMGYSLRFKPMVSHSDYGNYTPYWVPGYGEGSKSFAVGMSYSVFYAIPIKKVQLDFEYKKHKD